MSQVQADREIDKLMLEPIPLVLPGMILPTAEELKASNVGMKPFNRNLKPLIKLRHYPKSKRSYWVVVRDYSIKWPHLTMQEKSNIDAAYDYCNRKNDDYR